MFKTTVNQTLITFSGTVINGFLGLLFYVFVARFLGPANFGILTVAITTLTLVADIADLGVDTGLIRFVGKYFSKDKEKAVKFMKLGLKVKVLVYLSVLLLGWLLAPFLSHTIFIKAELEQPLKLALIGVGGALLLSFATHSLQALQRFWVWSFLNIFLNGLRLLIIITLGLSLTVENTLITYIVIPFLGFLIGLLFLPNFLVAKNELAVAKEFFNYNKWVAAITLVAALGARLDTFLLARLTPSSAVGIYSAASQLSSIVPQIVLAVATVAAPKLAAFKSDIQAIQFLKKLQLLVIILATIGLLAIPLSFFIIPLIFTAAYTQSISIFSILLLSQLIFLIALPSHQAIFYYFGRPNIFVTVSLINIMIVGLLGWFLILNLGVQGAAWAVLIGQISNLLIPAIWVLNKFKNRT